MIHHGGRLRALRRLYPDAPDPLVDLSTGINPFPYSFPPLPAEAHTRLPDVDDIGALKAIAADAYGCASPDLIAVAPGAQILISSLPHVLSARRVAILSPTYGEYAAAWRGSGADVREVTDRASLIEADVGVLCNPNNPDGQMHDPAGLLDLVEDRKSGDFRLIVDEAFAEFSAAGCSAAPYMPRSGTILLRSFGKAYGLAGVRLGFLVSDRETVAAVQRLFGPWPISGAAIHMARAALQDSEWRRAMGVRLADAAGRLDALLEANGFEILGGTDLFRLALREDAERVAVALGRAGLLVRNFPERRDWLRFGLPPNQKAWSRLERVLATVQPDDLRPGR